MSTELYSTGEVPKVGDYIRSSDAGQIIWRVTEVIDSNIRALALTGDKEEYLLSILPCIKLTPLQSPCPDCGNGPAWNRLKWTDNAHRCDFCSFVLKEPPKPFVVCAVCHNRTRLTPCPTCNPKPTTQQDDYDFWKRFYKETKPIIRKLEELPRPTSIFPPGLQAEILGFLIQLRDTTNSRSEHEKLIQLIEKLK